MNEELKGRDGMGRCKECIYHDMDGYDHYCLDPKRQRDGERRRWMNDTYARGWHDCCIVFKDGD